MLRDGTVFQDFGVNYFNQRDREHISVAASAGSKASATASL
jgi:hypothetical protein